MMTLGVLIMSILIGLVCEVVEDYMQALNDGKTIVVESGHTLVLGWNEATARVICQCAFLRRVFQKLNETPTRRLFPWTRAIPSTPVANAPIVVMNNQHSKAEMQAIMIATFAARNLEHKYARMGLDVVFRTGDPANNHDLVRVAAHKATSVVIMMTETDSQEKETGGGGVVAHPATIRTILALRNVIYSNGWAALTFNMNLRVVVHLESDCKFINAMDFIAPDGRQCLYAQDMSLAINTLLFYCAAKPGLSRLIIGLLNFEGQALRCRPSWQIKAGPNNEANWCAGKTVREAMLHNCWGNATMVGCDDRLQEENTNDGFGQGIAADPNYVIKTDDIIIFISTTSSPSVSEEAAAQRAKFDEEAKPLVLMSKVQGAILSTAAKSKILKTKPEQHVLVMGWRPEWDSAPMRFANRLKDIASGLPPGSTVTTVNDMPQEEMHRFMSATGLPRSGEDAISEPAGLGRFKKAFQSRGAADGTPLSEDPEVTPEDGSEYPESEPLAPTPIVSRASSRSTEAGSPKHASGKKVPSSRDAPLGTSMPDLPEGHESGSSTPIEAIVSEPEVDHVDPDASWIIGDGVTVSHYPANPASYMELRRVFFDKGNFHTAICLGTVSGERLPSYTRDSRVMSMMLELRAITKERGETMHIVAENQIDQTATLALGPRTGEDSFEADFVNTQAIIARCLAMNLGYPFMWDALKELIMPGERSPEVDFLEPVLFGLVGAKTSFGAIHRALLEISDGRGLVIGFGSRGNFQLNPKPETTIEWTKQHRIVVIIRRNFIYA